MRTHLILVAVNINSHNLTKVQLESNDHEPGDTTQPQVESNIESNIESKESKNEINTIFENPREYLLESEKEKKIPQRIKLRVRNYQY